MQEMEDFGKEPESGTVQLKNLERILFLTTKQYALHLPSLLGSRDIWKGKNKKLTAQFIHQTEKLVSSSVARS